MKTINIRARAEDVQKMRKECLELYLKAHPEEKRLKFISDQKLFASLIRHYLS